MTSADLSDVAAPDVLARLRAVAPVVWLDEFAGWFVLEHVTAVAVMRNADDFTVDDPRFSTAQLVGPSMLSVDGAEHRRHRTPFGPPFRPARVEARFGARIRALSEELVERIRPDGHADLRATVAGPLAVAVIAELLGLGDVDAGRVLGWYAAIVAAVSAITAGDAVDPASGAAFDELSTAVRASLEHGDSPLLGEAENTLTEAEIVANAAVMMFGGIETTDAMISNLLVHLLGNDDAYQAVLDDPSLVAAAVEESLRLEPAAAVVDRYAVRDVVVAGVPVAAGDLVRVSIAAANRDPAVFAEPDRFVLGRPNIRSQVAFARGPHTCIAMDLARLETVIAVTVVLERLPGLRLDGPAAATGLVFRKPAAVPVSWNSALRTR